MATLKSFGQAADSARRRRFATLCAFINDVPRAMPKTAGTALPICRNRLALFPVNAQFVGNPCNCAHSLQDRRRKTPLCQTQSCVAAAVTVLAGFAGSATNVPCLY